MCRARVESNVPRLFLAKAESESRIRVSICGSKNCSHQSATPGMTTRQQSLGVFDGLWDTSRKNPALSLFCPPNRPLWSERRFDCAHRAWRSRLANQAGIVALHFCSTGARAQSCAARIRLRLASISTLLSVAERQSHFIDHAAAGTPIPGAQRTTNVRLTRI
jgi:hypothetical protein